jgi:hypothetical protein
MCDFNMLLLPTEWDGQGDPRRKTLTLRHIWEYWVRHEIEADLSVLAVKILQLFISRALEKLIVTFLEP